mmetsp:Transcript_2867/g.3962  ORF Transcript_2867/g.3962 Transcript_2867/m.3962 type:complete len:164 (-) Transcript_2867:237-728(-)
MASESKGESNDTKDKPEMRVLTVHLEPVLIPRFSGHKDRIMMDVTSCEISRERALLRTKGADFEADVALLMAQSAEQFKPPPRRGLRAEEYIEKKPQKSFIKTSSSNTPINISGNYIAREELSNTCIDQNQEWLISNDQPKSTQNAQRRHLQKSQSFRAVGLR